MLAQKVKIKDKRIEVIKNWPKPKSVKNFQVFLSFANFYQQFIQSFSKIAGSLILMFKITKVAKNVLLLSIAEDAEINISGGDCEDETVKRSSFKNLSRATGYLTSDAR